MNTDFEKNSKAALDYQAETLSTQTLQRLAKARQTALHGSATRHSGNSKASRLYRVLGTAGGFALASILTFLIVSGVFQQKSLSPLDDLDMLTAEADLDVILQSDFYLWLDETGLGETSQL